MTNPADPDLVFPVPCRHCTRLLHGDVRFCPYCGGEEAAVRADTGMVTATVEPERWAPARTEPVAQFAMETAFVTRRELQQKVDFPPALGAPRKLQDDDAEAETTLLGPAAFEWPEGLPAVITVEARTPKPRLGALLVKPVAIGTALVLSMLALALVTLQPGPWSRSAGPSQPAAKLEQAQSAPGRGDLDTAQRELGALAAAYPGHAAVQPLQDELEQREREQSARREQLRDAAQKTAQALGLDDLSHLPPPAAPAALSAATAQAPGTPAAAPPSAPPIAVQESVASACGEALAALALCPQEDARQAPAR